MMSRRLILEEELPDVTTPAADDTTADVATDVAATADERDVPRRRPSAVAVPLRVRACFSSSCTCLNLRRASIS
jgi:hypothetical protein